ncbi:MAG TPA: acyl-ACP--UDP-N-acetylglucosamine O-acyltransferase [Gemmatimonadales bacterium]|jgi:UDP-N-acetylglucosamine acyltransferase|nr:acyl-ACP--UDP-N-acetylglucosamine O-acyltransferase [Gemmatimonadales bacterium]
MTWIHPTALVDPGARLGQGVEVGPWAIVGPGVNIGDGCKLGPHASLERNVRLGAGSRVGQGSILGGDPQDLKYRGEESWVEVGEGVVIREYSTVNRGTAQSGTTRIGAGSYLMSYVHVAHDCQIGEGVILSNGTQLAGHVTIQDRANLSGLVAVHQFVTIGTLAFIGGCSRVTQDIPPYVKAVGNPVELFGLNTLGLQRAGVPADTIAVLKRLYRLCFNSELNFSQALDRARMELPALPEVERFLEFLATSERGVPA